MNFISSYAITKQFGISTIAYTMHASFLYKNEFITHLEHIRIILFEFKISHDKIFKIAFNLQMNLPKKETVTCDAYERCGFAEE